MARPDAPSEAKRSATVPPLAERVLAELRPERVDAWAPILRNLTLPDVAAYLAFDPERYTRTLLVADDRMELLVMGWLPGQTSVVHDHGKSEGAAIVLAGEATEETFASTGGGRVRRTGTRTLKRGDSTLERRTDIHRVFNASTNLLVTLHAYAPRLTEYQTYDA